MKRPEEVTLNRAQGDGLIKRLEQNQLSAEDRRVLAKLVQFYFWLTFALSETKIILKRLKIALFGKGTKKPSGGTGDDDGDDDNAGDAGRGGADSAPGTRAGAPEQPSSGDASASKSRPCHGCQSAAAYSGAVAIKCCHEHLAPGQRCPLCGLGQLYRLPSGVEIRIDGNALLSAVRYELEKLHGLRHTPSTSCLRQTVLDV